MVKAGIGLVIATLLLLMMVAPSQAATPAHETLLLARHGSQLRGVAIYHGPQAELPLPQGARSLHVLKGLLLSRRPLKVSGDAVVRFVLPLAHGGTVLSMTTRHPLASLSVLSGKGVYLSGLASDPLRPQGRALLHGEAFTVLRARNVAAGTALRTPITLMPNAQLLLALYACGALILLAGGTALMLRLKP